MSDGYRQAVLIWPWTDEAIEAGAKALAQEMAGGHWMVNFTEEQRNFWRARVRAALMIDDARRQQP